MIELILIATAAVAALMFVLWLIHLALRNAAIVDAGWAGGLAVVAVIYAVFGEGNRLRSTVIAAMAAIWGVRLGGYLLFTRVIGHPEEGRYVELRRKWGGNLPFKFLLFFEFQALLCVLLSIPFLLPSMNPAPGLSTIESVAIVMWCSAVLGESVADAQLKAFKLHPANRGKTCRAGLWNYSRHPNYFFEWLIWISFALFASASPHGYLAWSAPALISYFLFRVTGIPATEEQALRTKGDDYRDYQLTTSAFVPWFHKK